MDLISTVYGPKRKESKLGNIPFPSKWFHESSCKCDVSGRNTLAFVSAHPLTQARDYLIDLDGKLVRKFSKHLFWKDILISFQWVTQMGLETPQFFSFQNISTNTVARGVQSLGQNWLWRAG